MRLTLVPLLVAALVVLAVVPATAEAQRNPTADEASNRGQEKRDGAPASDGSDDPDDDAGDGGSRESGRGRSGERPDGRPASPTPVPIGSFAVDLSAQHATGEFVSFRYGAAGLESFTADGVTLFNLTPVQGTLRDLEEVEVKGSRMKLKADGLEVVIHDNPGAVSRIESDEPIALDFAGALNVTRHGEGRHYTFTLDGLSGTIKADELHVNGSRVVFEGDLLLMLGNMRAAADEHRPQILDAIGRGHVGAEASFNKRNDALEQEVVSYGNVTMTTVKAERGNLTVLIDGHGFDGRVLVLNVDGRVVGASAKEQLDILFDNETIAHADDLNDILDPDNDGLKPEYYVVFDPQLEAFQLIVSVPHYSVHTLSVTLVEFLPPPSVVVGIVAGVALLVPSAYVLFRRKPA